MQSVWNNTYINDTVVYKPNRGAYLRNDRAGFPYDFIYQMEDDVYLYLNGKLEDIELKKARVVTYSAVEAIDDLAYESNALSTTAPMGIVEDTAWQRRGKLGDLVYYEKPINDTEDEYGHSYTYARLHIDSMTSENFTFNTIDSLTYAYPENFQTTAYADLENEKANDLPAVGDSLPMFDLVDVNGNAYSSETVQGKKLVFVFSFIGCGGCELARKHLAKSGFQFNEDYLAIYLNPMNSAEQIANYHQDKPWPFNLVAIDYDFSARFGVYSYPTFISVSASGAVEEVIEGYDEDEFMEFFEDKGTVL